MEIVNGMTADEHDAIERFPIIAKEFCRLINDLDKFNRKQFVKELAVHLSQLCEVAVRLPCVVPATEDIYNTRGDVTAHTEEWAKRSRKLRLIFGALDGYWEVFDPTEKEDPVSCSLGIDIAEIYLDLEEALKLHKSGAALNDVHWEWRFNFHSHWSKHAASALRVLLHISDLA